VTWSSGTVEALAAAGRAPVLLIACDYDGTIAPIVDDPSQAHPLRPAIAGLRGLASLPDTHVAVVSGRSLRDLAVLSRLPEEVHLVGSHGSEFEPHAIGRLDASQVELLHVLTAELAAIAETVPGCSIETKPAGVAFHYRRAGDQEAGVAAATRILEGPALLPGAHVREGKCVVELSVVDTDKGGAIDRLRAMVGADTVVFIGDDVTDEDGFARLRGPDVGVKVGPGDSLATYRVADPEEVGGLLGRLLDERAGWVAGHRAPPIERHSMLSDHRTLALVDPVGRISWMCHPRADSQAIFAELLGGPTAGFYAVSPLGDGGGAPIQRYLPETMVVETQWRTHRVTDYLDASAGRPTEHAGRTDLVRVIEGTGALEVLFAPRLDFGRNVTELELVPGGVTVVGGPEAITLYAPGVTWEIVDDGPHQSARAVIDFERGSDPVVLDLHLGGEPITAGIAVEVVTSHEAERRSETVAYWREIAATLKLPAVATSMVRRSALTLEALRYRPSGAMLAAATTSLPESIGGPRNWDYRYCWPRDSSMACASLVRLGRTEPGIALLDWLCERIDQATRPDLLRPLYRVTGDEHVPEGTIAELAGYAGSRPVRIGNAAENQVQLDALGPVAELVHLISTSGGGLRPAHWTLMERITEVVVDHWTEPDHGIWEVRLARQHNVVSKVMCWLVVDRAIRLADATGREVPDKWASVRQAIVDEVLDRGWNDDKGSFVSAYDGEHLDAGLLMMGTCGFIDPNDPRFDATVRRIERELCDGPAVYRYHNDDGLSGVEGGMLICTGWLVQALVACGRVDDAADWFDRLVIPAGPTGLLPEQIDPGSERALGNFPQAYSHLAVIDSAVALAAHGLTG